MTLIEMLTPLIRCAALEKPTLVPRVLREPPPSVGLLRRPRYQPKFRRHNSLRLPKSPPTVGLWRHDGLSRQNKRGKPTQRMKQ